MTMTYLGSGIDGSDQGERIAASQVLQPTKTKMPRGVILGAPVASFSYITTDNTVTFDATASYDPDGDITSYSWDFGDGSTVEGLVTPSHEYLETGTYVVLLSVTDNDGLTGSDSATLTIIAGTILVPRGGLYPGGTLFPTGVTTTTGPEGEFFFPADVVVPGSSLFPTTFVSTDIPPETPSEDL